MAKLRTMIEALREVRAQQGRIGDLERELQRVSPQLAALEQRVEALTERLSAGHLVVEPGDEREARALLEEVRNEHARVRARISAATVFEERLRVVEQQLGIDSATGRVAGA